ncbi:protein of unknown function [Burkholderia multivorans]
MDDLAGLWPCFGRLVAMQVRAWLVARPLARLLLIQLGLAPAAVLLIGVSSYSLPARRPAPLRFSVAVDADLFDL